MNYLDFLRTRNRLLNPVWPAQVARINARLFLTPQKHPPKEWEKLAEEEGQRVQITPDLSALAWGKEGDPQILLMHGWGSRATQMHGIAQPLVGEGFRVIALDAPGHGQSGGERSNPVAFASAIVAVNEALGPFVGAIGHSMGAAALAIARSMGAELGRYVFIAAPHSIHETLEDFCNFMQLSRQSREKFIDCIEQEVGRPARELAVGELMKEHSEASLLIHARNDKEIPYTSMARIKAAMPRAQTLSPDDLGHRKIVRDPIVAAAVKDYMTTGRV